MKHRSRTPKQRRHPKTRLRLPDLEVSKSAVLNSLSSVDGQRGYGHAIDEFVDWYCSEPRLALNKTVVLRYRSYLEARLLAPGTVNLRLGAVRRLAYEAADSGNPSPTVSQITQPPNFTIGGESLRMSKLIAFRIPRESSTIRPEQT